MPTCAAVKVKLVLAGLTVWACPGIAVPSKRSAAKKRARDIDT